jgi:large subunit ribosomal protein L31
MQKEIHPDYHYVVFKDIGADYAFLTRSTRKSTKTIKWTDGKEYPMIEMEISSATHPFFTGQQRFMDTAGRIEKFQRKYQNVQPAAKKS